MKKQILKKLTNLTPLILFFTLLITPVLFSCKNSSAPSSPSHSESDNPHENPDIPDPFAPVLLNNLESQTVTFENDFTLTIEAENQDEGTLSYKWYKASDENSKGTLIEGKNEKTITEKIDKKETDVVCYYYVEVTNTINGKTSEVVTSNRAEITANNKVNAEMPVITANLKNYDDIKPKNLTLRIGILPPKTGTISYKWYKSDNLESTTPITEATTAEYTIPEKELEGSYYYWCEVTNTNNTATGLKLQTATSSKVLINIHTPGSLGYNYPESGKYSPVDTNGKTAGLGWKNQTYKLGATVSGSDVEFAVYSKHADKILLEIYDTAYGKDAIHDYWMEKGSDNIWRAKISGLSSGTLYAFRCWGPNWTFDNTWERGNSEAGFHKDYDETGNRFNPNKVLFDPYAKEISHDKSNPDSFGTSGFDAGMYGSGADDYNGVARRNFDTGKYAPKAVVVNDYTTTGIKPAIPQEEARIYEAHVRGLTKHSSTASLTTILNGIPGFEQVNNVPAEKQGTYAGAALMAPYLKALGINTIELLPVHETDNDHNTGDASQFVDSKPAGNFWGYMTYGYFAPDRRYSSDKSYGGPTREFKDMVRAFHDAGIEVYLDVVFNHTGEGGPWYGGPKIGAGENAPDNPNFDNYNTAELTFLRGFDCSEYYCLTPGNVGDHWNTTGCGNNLRCDNSPVRNLILDSLTYWIDDMGVDGYRFDLAPVLGRKFVNNEEGWKYASAAETLTAIKDLGTQKNAEMIAEAWDCHGGDGYQVGNFPSGWGEWNGRYRDGLRGYVNGGNPQAKDGSITQYINGDYDRFNDQGGPQKSVNFVVAHDGFTLADLCSYPGPGNTKNATLSWPFGPSDGGDGAGNPLAFGNSPEMKRQANRNYTAIQMMSRGVPMIVYGDEFCRTQNGNNNPYNIDSVATWNNYKMINTDSPHTVPTYGDGSYDDNFGKFANNQKRNGNFMFMKYMLDLKAKEPALNQANYNVTYDFRKENGTDYLGQDDRCIWLHIDGDKVAGGSDYLVFMNMYTAAVDFKIPAELGKQWIKLVDTSSGNEGNFNYWEESLDNKVTDKYNVPAWSVVILKQKQDPNVVTVETPVISATGTTDGSTFKDKLTVSITCKTPDAEIYYTVDETTPSISSTKYTEAFNITKTTTIKAYAVKDGCFPSNVATKTFTNIAKVEPPVLSVPEGDFWNTITVFVTSTDGNKDFYYTKNSNEPTNKSTKYNASTGIDITDNTTLKVVGINSAGTKSDVVTATYTKKDNATYEEDPYGVMLQGFNWDSAPRGDEFNLTNPNPKWGTWYETMKTNATDMQKFEYVWFPPASKTDYHSPEGYAPTELNDLNSFYGTEKELEDVITAISPAKPIADIVVNHRAGTTSWGDFQNPKWTDDYYSVCGDDEGFSDSKSPMYNSPAKGNPDTGGQYEAYRDLDHTNPAVQKGIISWMNTVLKRAGFTGWRYDYVKGFDGKYVGQYNKATNPSFSVGELWPDDKVSTWKEKIDNWINATGNNSRAFDFVLKSNMNEAFGWMKDGNQNDPNKNKWDLSLLASDNSLMRYNPGAAVTFIDNHDTGSTQQHWEIDPGDLGPAYAFLLTHPGYPCVAWQHYFTGEGSQYRGDDIVPGTEILGGKKTFKEHIDNLIAIRKNVGIRFDAKVEVLEATKTNYVAKIPGTDGKEIIVKIGGNKWNPTGTGYDNNNPIYAGVNFAIWQKDVDGTYLAEPAPSKEKTVVYIGSTYDEASHIHMWNALGDITTWPGKELLKTDDGYSYFIIDSPVGVNFLFNGKKDGQEKKTPNFTCEPSGHWLYFWDQSINGWNHKEHPGKHVTIPTTE